MSDMEFQPEQGHGKESGHKQGQGQDQVQGQDQDQDQDLGQEQERQWFESLLRSAERYLQQLGLPGLSRLDPTATDGKHRLEDITAFIQVGKALEGGIVLTIEERLARSIAKLFMLEPITDAQAAQYAVEVIAEAANILTGNALAEREHSDICLGNPLMILTRRAEIRAKSRRLLCQAYEADEGRFRVIYIPMEHKAELASILAVQLDERTEA
ncbi:chemotaxis protein CheX [Paenibacillus koleovorans]|uniref:chemotaxis protein CheX n=1 Tax=Paenibacillus koleovorans TaxID=121608 RepID=UPI0013E3FDDE|nr:chemotaxis protein CheX [Paenibacillus koleovorans]